MADPRRIIVTIDHLVLRGVAPHQRGQCARALERGLAQVIAARGLPATGSVQAGALTTALRPGLPVHPGVLGHQAALAVHRALVKRLQKGGMP